MSPLILDLPGIYKLLVFCLPSSTSPSPVWTHPHQQKWYFGSVWFTSIWKKCKLCEYKLLLSSCEGICVKDYILLQLFQEAAASLTKKGGANSVCRAEPSCPGHSNLIPTPGVYIRTTSGSSLAILNYSLCKHYLMLNNSCIFTQGRNISICLHFTVSQF